VKKANSSLLKEGGNSWRREKEKKFGVRPGRKSPNIILGERKPQQLMRRKKGKREILSRPPG